MLRLFLFAMILVLPIFGQQQDRRIEPIVAHRQVALVIGNSAYANQPLKNPVNDAQAMGRRLRELNYDVTVVTDAGNKAMGHAIDSFLDKLRTGDVAFFYYSGHGMQVEGENYLIPVDFRSQTEADVRYDAQAAGRIQDRMEKSGAQLNILVLDACRNNPFRAASRSGTQGLAFMSGGRGTFIAFATAPGRTASDNSNGKNGLFTQYLLEALATPGLGLDDVFNLVRVRVDEASGGKQLPWTLSSVVGRYSFVSDGAPPAGMNPPSSPDPFRDVLLSYVSLIRELGDPLAPWRPSDQIWSPKRKLPGARCLGYEGVHQKVGSDIDCFFGAGSYDEVKRQVEKSLSGWGSPPDWDPPSMGGAAWYDPASQVEVRLTGNMDQPELIVIRYSK